jgi:hypothetical protein
LKLKKINEKLQEQVIKEVDNQKNLAQAFMKTQELFEKKFVGILTENHDLKNENRDLQNKLIESKISTLKRNQSPVKPKMPLYHPITTKSVKLISIEQSTKSMQTSPNLPKILQEPLTASTTVMLDSKLVTPCSNMRMLELEMKVITLDMKCLTPKRISI